MPITPQQPTATAFRGVDDHSWLEAAACGRHPVPDLWYPEGAEASRHAARAQAICRWCPVRVACLDVALETDDRHGIRGGLTEDERVKLHNKRRTRLDPDRVAAALAGRRIPLTLPEQRAVAFEGAAIGISRKRLALILDADPSRVTRLIREGHDAHDAARTVAIPLGEAA